jgi:hypothetical protein
LGEKRGDVEEPCSQDASQASYEEVKDWLQEELLTEKKQEKVMDYMESLRGAGRIMYNSKNSAIPV